MRKLIASIIIAISSLSYAQQVDVWIGSKMNGSLLLDNSNVVDTWGFGFYSPGLWGISVPGPVLEFTQGDSVNLFFVNDSPEDHTIHLHGLDVSQDEDGVPSTSFAVNPDDTVEYNFVAANPGVFLYHCHVLTTLHLTMGMYGMIVVNASDDPTRIYNGGPSFTSSYNFLNSDLEEALNSNPTSPGFLNEIQTDYFMVNGLGGNLLYNSSPNQVSALTGDSVLLRIGSMAYTKTQYIFPEELNARAYMSDGRILPSPFDCDTLVVHSGERYSVLLTPTVNVNTDIKVNSYEMRNNQLQGTNLIRLNANLGYGEESSDFNVYPNPSNGLMYIVTEEPNGQLEVFDLKGSLVHYDRIEGQSAIIDLSELENGTYILRYMDAVYKIMLFR